MLVRELMTSPAVSLRTGMPLDDAIEVLAGRHITAIPIVDAQGHVVGILSEADVLKQRRPSRRLVDDVMTREPATVDEGCGLGSVVEIFTTSRAKSLPVLQGAHLVGVISRSDLVRALAATSDQQIAALTGVTEGGVMLVSELMTRDVVSVHPNSPLTAAVRALADRRISALPVVDDRGYVVGILSERDVLTPRGAPGGYSCSPPQTVRELMSKSPVTAFRTADVAQVAHLMSVNGWKSLPVTDEHEVLVGVISRSDIIRALA